MITPSKKWRSFTKQEWTVAKMSETPAVEVQSEGEVALHEVAWHVVELHVVALHVVAGEVDKRAVVGKLRVVHLVQVAQPHPEVALPRAGDVPQMEEHLVGIDHLRSAEHLVAEDLVVVLPSDHLVGYSARDLVVVDPVAHPVVAHPVVVHLVVVHLVVVRPVVVHLVVAHPVVVHLVVVRPVVAVQHHVPGSIRKQSTRSTTSPLRTASFCGRTKSSQLWYSVLAILTQISLEQKFCRVSPSHQFLSLW